MKSFIVKLYWFIKTQIGFDPRALLRSILGLPLFLRDLVRFTLQYKGSMRILPCLQDRFEDSGFTKSEYFWQDLFVARKIFARTPEKHVDVGSRIDGFIAHLASFREVEVLDIRPLQSTIPGVTFKQADLMNDLPEFENYCDSFSCLHTLEHFGLGRYGDPISIDGYQKGLKNMSKMVKTGGTFYLSVPLGVERVEFNANRVFSPATIVDTCLEYGLKFKELHLIEAEAKGMTLTEISESQFEEVARKEYSLGIFEFEKIA